MKHTDHELFWYEQTRNKVSMKMSLKSPTKLLFPMDKNHKFHIYYNVKPYTHQVSSHDE